MLLKSLTEYEKFYVILNKCGDFIVMSVAFAQNQDPNIELTENIVKKALIILQKRHPYLRSFIDKQSNIQIQNENYDPIDLDWSNNSITYAELMSDLEIFNSKLFKFDYQFVFCKVASFIHSTGDKMYSINLSLPLMMTGKF